MRKPIRIWVAVWRPDRDREPRAWPVYTLSRDSIIDVPHQPSDDRSRADEGRRAQSSVAGGRRTAYPARAASRATVSNASTISPSKSGAPDGERIPGSQAGNASTLVGVS